MKKDRIDKRAIVQRDNETYAIVPHMAGGICTPELLRKIADVAEKYGAKAIKVTESQRIAIVGIKEEDLDRIWKDLGVKPAAAIGMCVRSIKFCPGKAFCRLAQQDTISIGTKLDEIFHGYSLPGKMKIAISGCPNCCTESWVRDIGLIGTKKGWNVVVGGSAGSRPMIGHLIAKGLSDEEAMDLVRRIIEKFKEYGKPRRLGRLIEEIGIERFKEEIGISHKE